jgi:hypothetical protein
MLARLRALRERLLRRNRCPCDALAPRFERSCRRFLGRVVRQHRRSETWDLWRYAQAGDLPGYGAAIDGHLLQMLVAANAGKRVIAFTHKPVLGNDPVAVENRRLIAAAVEAGFTINLSADNPVHADQLAALGIAPVVTVLAHAYARNAARHRFKRHKDIWGEMIGQWLATAPLICRGAHPSAGALRFARQPIRTRPAEAAAPAPASAMP